MRLSQRSNNLATNIDRTAHELDKVKEQIYKLEALSSQTESIKKVASPAIPAPADVVKSESLTSNNNDVKIFKTSKDLVIQLVDLSTSTAYTKTIQDSSVKSLTLASYSDTAGLYEALVELVKGSTGSTAFTITEGKLIIVGLKKKVGVQMEKVEGEAPKNQDIESGPGDAKLERLSSELAAVARELNNTKETDLQVRVSFK